MDYSINFQATMKLQGIEKSNKLKNVITSVRNRTQQYPHDTIVMSENGFDINYGKASIPTKYMKELFAMPEELISNTIVKLFFMHKNAEKTVRVLSNALFNNLKKAPSKEQNAMLLNSAEMVTRCKYKMEAENHFILKHIDFENVRFS